MSPCAAISQSVTTFEQRDGGVRAVEREHGVGMVAVEAELVEHGLPAARRGADGHAFVVEARHAPDAVVDKALHAAEVAVERRARHA